MPDYPPGASAAILAGGQNRRMGTNKALLEIGGKSILERTAVLLQGLFEEVMVIGFDIEAYSPLGLPVWPDIRPGHGSLGGIHTALSRATHQWVLCVACDMPFLNSAVVTYLLSRTDDRIDAVIPRLAEGWEPLCAVYSKNILPVIERSLEAGEHKIKKALEGINYRIVESGEVRPFDPRLLTFFNINTPQDLDLARQMLEHP